MEIPSKLRKELEKKQYGVFGHAAVQICSWTKKSLQGRGKCYKGVFYGVHTHRCMQFSPAAVLCSNNCIYCWRPAELMGPERLGKNALAAIELIEGLIELRRKLLSGFGGREGTPRRLWEESLIPDHYAISLSGEPTLYPSLPDLIIHLKEKIKARSIFLVTNGTRPDMLLTLARQNALPNQLYISIIAPNESLYNKIARSRLRQNWQSHKRSLAMLARLQTRTVLRLTLIAGLNDRKELLSEFAAMILKAAPTFVEVKGYMFLGYSRQRLKMSNMPTHTQVKGFSEQLVALLQGYELAAEHTPSRIVLLRKRGACLSLFDEKD